MKMKLWAVFDKDYRQNNIMYMVGTSKKECFEWVDKMLQLENMQHYKMWCELRNLKLDSKSWFTYKRATKLSNDKYTILSVVHDKKSIACSLRTAINYIPVGCSYEQDIEYIVFLKSLSQDMLKEIPDDLKQELKNALETIDNE